MRRANQNSMMIEFKGSHFQRDVILWGVRWYVAYPINYRHLEEMMDERGVEVDHSTLNRWVIKYAPELERRFRSRKRPVGSRWRLDETYVKIKGSWSAILPMMSVSGRRGADLHRRVGGMRCLSLSDTENNGNGPPALTTHSRPWSVLTSPRWRARAPCLSPPPSSAS